MDVNEHSVSKLAEAGALVRVTHMVPLSHHFGVREGRRVGLVAAIGEFYIDSISWQFVLDVLYLWYPGHLRCLFFMLPPFIFSQVSWNVQSKTEKRSDIMYCCTRGQRSQLMPVI